jgi:hypothetical protein
VGPIWVQWIFSVSCLAIGGYYATVLITRRGDLREGSGKWGGAGYELSHLGMALGMAAMFSPIGDPLPRLMWLLVFGMLAAWFASRTLREGLRPDDTAQHLVANLAMLFMVLAMGGHTVTVGTAGAHAGHEGHAAGGADGSGLIEGPVGTVLSVLLAGYFAVHAVRALRRLVTASRPDVLPGAPAAGGAGAVTAVRGRAQSRVEAATHVVMSLSMTVMFGLML